MANKSLRPASHDLVSSSGIATSATNEFSPLLQSNAPSCDESIHRVRYKPLSWIVSIWHDYLSVELQNTQSVARDHLANERTFLAWLRTSLSFASAGVAVTQFLRLDTSKNASEDAQKQLQQLRRIGKPAGASLIAIAMLVILGGASRYFTVQQALRRDRFPVSRLLVASLAGSAILFLVLSFVAMLILNPSVGKHAQ
ncbi:hypothetical protein BCR37DRAFT_230794 [Protomyces lactucae-debilis]|uniref:DUF202 domain-containing protein n=1 Tax=Protomyces lactucae-debilis TaxID=2754530 RepID=A0A1Y2EQ08_PROLT|nr:uncharacterized protein BCR37DRAFT_230794 [Protomyces lactucae-debilis]ORY73683.1 hypothetical protein BCR37DRAFT_230794 [Protomyces lactucae-debilis]